MHRFSLAFRRFDHMILLTIAVVFFFVICNNVVIMFAIRKFSRLKRHHYNKFIFHSAALDTLNRILIMCSLLSTTLPLPDGLIPAIFGSELISALIFADFFLALLTAVDWYIATYRPHKWENFKKWSHSLIVAVYLYICIAALYGLLLDIRRVRSGLSGYFLLLTACATLVTVVAFSTIHLCRRKQTSSFPLKIALFKVLIWVPFALSAIAALLVPFASHLILVFAVFVAVAPCEQLLLSYFWDGDYRAALSRMIACKCDGRAGGMEGLDDASTEEAAVAYQVEKVEAGDARDVKG